jgi:hypothetical protein
MRAHLFVAARFLSQGRMPLGQGYPPCLDPVIHERTVPRRQSLASGRDCHRSKKCPARSPQGVHRAAYSRVRLGAERILRFLPRPSESWARLKRRPQPQPAAPSGLASSRAGRQTLKSSASKALACIAKALLCAAPLAPAHGEVLAYEKLAAARIVPTSEMRMPGHLQPATDPTFATPKESSPSPELAKATISGAPSATVEFVEGVVPNPQLEPAPNLQTTTNAFACLGSASDVVLVTGFHDTKYITSNAKNRAFDARSATFLIEKERHGVITSHGDPSQADMCWAGGYVYSRKPWDASWDHHKDLDGPTRNSSVINNESYAMTVTGMHFFNVHDGPRSSNGVNWTVQHVWGEYVRDDCIENDHFLSGKVYDSLFDGCYTGISTRPSKSSNGQGHVLTLERVLLRLHPMPYPYKWQSKGGGIDENGNPYSGSGIPYGHGKLFKFEERNLEINNHFVLKDSVFAAGFEHIGRRSLNVPHPNLIDQCQGVVFAWLPDSRFPGEDSITAVQRKFPNCVTILEGKEARDYWQRRVIEWHQRHPDVGKHRKPTKPGEVIFPLKF